MRLGDVPARVPALAEAPGRRAAVVDNGRTFAYGELAERVCAYAAALGPNPGVVGVLTARCTETTLVTHAVDLHGPQAPGPDVWWEPADNPPIGWALPHVAEHIDDSGELLIAGPSLALGYRGMPAEASACWSRLARRRRLPVWPSGTARPPIGCG